MCYTAKGKHGRSGKALQSLPLTLRKARGPRGKAPVSATASNQLASQNQQSRPAGGADSIQASLKLDLLTREGG